MSIDAVRDENQTRLRQRTIASAVLAVLLLVAGMSVPRVVDVTQGGSNMLALHLLMELFAIVIAMQLVAVSWHTFSAPQMRSANLLICGFLIVAGCDLMHALAYEGMPLFLVEGSTPRAIFFWLMGRSFELLTMALLALGWRPQGPRIFWLGIAALISCALVWFGAYRIDEFPLTFVKGQGVTPFKANYEYLLCLGDLCVAWWFWGKANASGKVQHYLLALATFLMGIGEIMFTAYVAPSDFQNMFGHVFKIVSYGLLYWATFVTGVRAPFLQLRESEERFRQAMEATSDGVWDWDIASDAAYFSPAYYRMLGYAPGEIPASGQSWSSQVHPDDRQRAVATVEECIDGRVQSFELEFRMRAKDGSWQWILGRGKALSRNSAGRVMRLIGTHVNITERKRSEIVTAQYHSVILASLDGFWITDKTGRILDVNLAICQMSGYTRDELLQLRIQDIEADETPEETVAHTREIAETGHVRFEARHRRKDGVILNVEVSVLYVPDLGERFFAFVHDITQRKRSEANLKLAANVFTHAGEGILITDPEGIIVNVNQAFIRITGYTREEALGKTPRLLNSGRQPEDYYREMWQTLIREGYWVGEVWNRRKNGEVYAEMLSISAVKDAEGKTLNYVALFTDITSIKEYQARLEHIAHYDVLTDLPNRVLLADRLHQAILQSQRRQCSVAVVYLDLDGFKDVNDKHGHNVGDQLLIAVAQTLKTALREGDTLARIGGDEFVAVLTDLETPDDCQPILVRLLEAAACPFVMGDITLNVSSSIGVAIYPQHGAEADQLVRCADQAMYVAKQTGKNKYRYFEAVSRSAQ
ncbi:MAG: PAS domain S-box protein [Sterolibacterium sp.]